MDADRLSVEEIRKLRQLMDRAEISQVINDYFNALDSRNLKLLEKVFTEDVSYTVEMIGVPPLQLEGFHAVVTELAEVAAFRTSHHGVRNMSIAIEGDRAHVDVMAIDALHDVRSFAGDLGPANRIIQHGLRYVDYFERRWNGWRIRNRKLYCLWQVVIPNPSFRADLPPLWGDCAAGD